MGQPSFTVALSALNEERLIADAIRSVLDQTRQDFELIVVDDGSTDDTAKVVSTFTDDSRVSLIRQRNRGLAPSLNTAIAAGSAPLVALIDADDLWLPDYLERMEGALLANPSAGFAFTDAWWLHTRSGRFFKKTPAQFMGAPEPLPQDPFEMAASLLEGNWVFGLTMMRREALDRVGGFKEHLQASEDMELWLRFLANGYLGVQASGRLVVFRDRADSMSKNHQAMYRSLAEVYHSVAAEPGFPIHIRQRAGELKAAMKSRAAETPSVGRSGVGMHVLRPTLGRLRRTLLSRHIWHSKTPDELNAAFPGFSWRLK